MKIWCCGAKKRAWHEFIAQNQNRPTLATLCEIAKLQHQAGIELTPPPTELNCSLHRYPLGPPTADRGLLEVSLQLGLCVSTGGPRKRALSPYQAKGKEPATLRRIFTKLRMYLTRLHGWKRLQKPSRKWSSFSFILIYPEAFRKFRHQSVASGTCPYKPQ